METAQKTKWAIDPAHTQVQFKIKHLMISTVTGTINSFEGTVEAEGNDFSSAEISFTADANSISTANEQRDGHLRSGDFFDTEKFPKITFKSTKVTKKDDENFEVIGDLTIRGITKPVTLAVEYTGMMKDPWGNMKAGFNLKGKMNRKDWGLTWNAALETGGVLVSDEVRIEAEVQLAKENKN
jgi:polyisoprenoid-binding protein YceI